MNRKFNFYDVVIKKVTYWFIKRKKMIAKIIVGGGI